jgi:HD-GYP domain-containing protein (c-di-GMP phosphodiesterase class II)
MLLGGQHLKDLNRLLEIIADIAAGRHSSDVMGLTGPDTAEPVRTIAEAMGLMMVKIEAREYHLEVLIKQLEELNQQIRRNTIATVSAMAKALAARDAYTEGHAERVSGIARLIAAEMGLTEGETELVELAGLLHDIGKIGFPDFLFLPHEGDNPKEIVREITRHPTTAAEILKDLDFLGPALFYIRCHHERPDGRGYPGRLKDADIPVGAKIIAVADAFDAITTDRPYQKASPFHEALAILKAGAGTKWDSGCVDALERSLPKIPPHADTKRAPREMLMCLWDHHQPGISLEPGPPGGARMRWLKPGVDFSKYHRLMLDPVVFFFAPESEYKGMDPLELKGLADAFKQQLVDSLKKRYPVVAVPGPDVVRIRFAITDLRQNRPVLSDITSEGPIGFGKDDLKKRTYTSWAGSGATAAELMVFDSMTREVVAAAKDERTIGLKEKFTQWGSAEDAFQYWADRLRLFLDQAHGVKG